MNLIRGIRSKLIRAHLWIGEHLGLTNYCNCWECKHCTAIGDGPMVCGCTATEEERECVGGCAIVNPCEAVWCERFECIEDVQDACLGAMSDGYHTFDELYEHRTVLIASLCNFLQATNAEGKDLAFKSWHHGDGSMYDGMFIVGVWTCVGWVTYHCEEKYWDMFDVPELEQAPEWDGASPLKGLRRLAVEFISGNWHGELIGE